MLQYASQRVRADRYGRLVKGLRRRPLTAETGVRFPYLLLKTQEQIVPEFFCYGLLPVECIGVSPNGEMEMCETDFKCLYMNT